ncbi:MAG: hypothetical protein GYB68_16440 [Chloroflexi bacterium]|nr:hypothetical protein [Chloroflexota bacterium]
MLQKYTLKDARRLLTEGKKREAAKIVAALIKETPGDAEVWMLAGQLAPSKEQALECYKRAFDHAFDVDEADWAMHEIRHTQAAIEKEQAKKDDDARLTETGRLRRLSIQR